MKRFAALVTAMVVLAVASPRAQPASAQIRHRTTFRADAAASHRLPRLAASRVVETDDVGDPYVLTTSKAVPRYPKAHYVLFWTTDWASNVPTAVSADLIHWHRIADALPVLPSWATPSRTMTWGPAATKVAGGFVLYFSTQEAASRHECIGVGFSKDPTGPYTDTAPAPLICQRSLGGSIDPSVVHPKSGSMSIVWKSDGNAARMPAGIWEQKLSDDGRSVLGVAHRLMGARERWQRGIVEAPAMLAASTGGWWLFYAGGSWLSSTYATGVAWCATVAGPCSSTSAKPFLAGLPKSVSPGGLDTFRTTSGQLWASYSAFPSSVANAEEAMRSNRVLEIARVISH